MQDAGVQSGRYSYAAAAVWDGNFTRCRWGKRECEPPHEGECWFYSCEQTTSQPANISCPAAGVQECPEMQWDTDANCGQVLPPVLLLVDASCCCQALLYSYSLYVCLVISMFRIIAYNSDNGFVAVMTTDR
eukprot:scaffold582632_cov41-Prasinocladus_malaysianus.AAC.1